MDETLSNEVTLFELAIFSELVILFELTALFELVTVEEADSDKTDAISAEEISEFIYTEDVDTELLPFKAVCVSPQAVNIIPASKLIDIPAKIIFLITFLLCTFAFNSLSFSVHFILISLRFLIVPEIFYA